MQGTDWETMDLLPPSLVEGRPGTMRVYLPPRVRGNTSYGILDYSAVVLAGPHHADPYLSQRIATALAGHFDMHPRDFRVTAPDATISDRFVEFPDIDLCCRAVREGYFLLANGTEVQLIQWTPELGMERYPMSYRARVKLFGVPVYNRNEREINHLISGIGYVDNMTSVYVDGRFESLRVLIACHDPKNIPQELLMTTNPRAKIVRVQLEGFINIANDLLPPSPPNEPQPPPTLWQAREVHEEGNSRANYRRGGAHREHRREDRENNGYRSRNGQGQNWDMGEILERVVRPIGEDGSQSTTPQVVQANRETEGQIMRKKWRHLFG